MVRKTSSGFFASTSSSVSLPYHVSRGYDNRTCTDMPLPPTPQPSTSSHELPSRDPEPSPEKESFDPSKYTRPYLDYMTNNPTAFHAVAAFTTQLSEAGFEALSERKAWNLQPGGKYYTTRNSTSLIAFTVGPKFKPGNGFAMVAGHIDALCMKLKPMSKLPNKGGYVQLGVAPYAGAGGSTWWDRDLGVGGRVLLKDGKTGRIVEKLVKLDWPIARIPTLAPHFGEASRGPFNPETQAVPIIGLDYSDVDGREATNNEADSGIKAGTFAATQSPKLVKAICNELGISDYSTLINWELELFDTQPAQVGGLDKEFIFAGRIDDKLCCYAAIEALLLSASSSKASSNPSSNSTAGSPSIIKLVACFDDEEIGSQLRQGAQSTYLSGTIERILDSFHPPSSSSSSSNPTEHASFTSRYTPSIFSQSMANSFLLSSDVIHAVNPNFLGAYLPQHSPRLNIGVAISADPNGHMTTDSVSTAFLHRVAEKCGSKLQVFQIRNDSRSGGTIGPMTSSRLGCRSVDAGIPQLSMHSMRATTGSLDPGLGVKLFAGFFEHFEEVDGEFAGI